MESQLLVLELSRETRCEDWIEPGDIRHVKCGKGELHSLGQAQGRHDFLPGKTRIAISRRYVNPACFGTAGPAFNIPSHRHRLTTDISLLE